MGLKQNNIMKLSEIHDFDGVNSILVFDTKGKILDSKHFGHLYETNIALMSQNIYERSRFFINEFVAKELNQIIFRFEEGFMLLSKFTTTNTPEKEALILIHCGLEANLGLLMNKLKNNK